MIDTFKNLFNSRYKKGLFIALCFIGAFFFVGGSAFIYPIDSAPNAFGILIYLLFVLLFIPILLIAFNIIDKYCTQAIVPNDNPNEYKRKLNGWQFGLIISAIILIPAVICLYTFNPGISSQDTFDTLLIAAHNIYGAHDWHPAFYSLTLHFITKIWDSTYAVILVQYAVYLYIILELFFYLRKKGLKDSLLIGFAIFCGFNSANFLHINSIWKDIPYTFCILWLMLIITKLSLDFDYYKARIYIYLELIIAMIGIYLYRKNGIVTFIIVGISLIAILWKNKKVLVALLISLILIVVAKGPIYNHYQFVNFGKFGMYCGLGNDIMSVYYNGGEVSDDAIMMLNVFTVDDIEGYRDQYHPNYFYGEMDLDVSPSYFIKVYLDTFFKNPGLMIRGIFGRNDSLWDIFQSSNELDEVKVVNFVGQADGWENWNLFYPEHVYKSSEPAVMAYLNLLSDTKIFNAIIWRSALLILIGLICTVYLFLKNTPKRYYIILTPIISHIIGLLLSCGWSDFRFYWPINLMLMAYFLFLAAIIKNSLK